MDNAPFDIVAIGDAVIDAFIKLSVGKTKKDGNMEELCIPYGTKIPYESVTVVPAVGNSANATVAASRLGLKAALVTFLGDDQDGKDCLNILTQEKVDTQFITQETGKKTNYHYVLWYKDDRTILIKHEEYTSKLPTIPPPKWLYVSSLGKHTLPLHQEIEQYLATHPEVKLAFQPGTFQLELGDQLHGLYKRAEVVCLNIEEAKELLSLNTNDIHTLLEGMSFIGPKIVIITDGVRGAYMKHDNEYYSIPIFPDIAPPLERTGAGDAFFSTFISYLAKGKTPREAIMRAPINSMNVVQHVGAREGLLSEEKLEEYLQKAPENYTYTNL